MVEQLTWLREVIINYPSFQYVTIFLGAALGGEVALFTLAFLAAQKIISPIALVLLSLVGTMCSDSMWFLLGRTNPAKKFIYHRYTTSTITVIAEAIRRVSRGSHLMALIFAKFLVGTRIVMLLYLSNLEFSFKEFIRYNVVATLIWLLVVIPTGYLSGLGFTYVAEVFQNIYAGLGFVFLVLIVIVILQLWLKKIFIHMRDR